MASAGARSWCPALRAVSMTSNAPSPAWRGFSNCSPRSQGLGRAEMPDPALEAANEFFAARFARGALDQSAQLRAERLGFVPELFRLIGHGVAHRPDDVALEAA